MIDLVTALRNLEAGEVGKVIEELKVAILINKAELDLEPPRAEYLALETFGERYRVLTASVSYRGEGRTEVSVNLDEVRTDLDLVEWEWE